MAILETKNKRGGDSSLLLKKGAIFKKKGGLVYSLLYNELHTVLR